MSVSPLDRVQCSDCGRIGLEHDGDPSGPEDTDRWGNRHVPAVCPDCGARGGYTAGRHQPVLNADVGCNLVEPWEAAEAKRARGDA